MTSFPAERKIIHVNLVDLRVYTSMVLVELPSVHLTGRPLRTPPPPHLQVSFIMQVPGDGLDRCDNLEVTSLGICFGYETGDVICSNHCDLGTKQAEG